MYSRVLGKVSLIEPHSRMHLVVSRLFILSSTFTPWLSATRPTAEAHWNQLVFVGLNNMAKAILTLETHVGVGSGALESTLEKNVERLEKLETC